MLSFPSVTQKINSKYFTVLFGCYPERCYLCTQQTQTIMEKPMIVEAQYLKVGDKIAFGQTVATSPSRGISTVFLKHGMPEPK